MRYAISSVNLVRVNVTFCIHFQHSLHSQKIWVDENKIEQCFAAHIVQCYQQHCSALLHLYNFVAFCFRQCGKIIGRVSFVIV